MILEILLLIFAVLWCIAVGVWLYTIINRRTREEGIYIYPLIIIMGFSTAIQVIVLIAQYNT